MDKGTGNRALQIVAYVFLGAGILAGIAVTWVPLSRHSQLIVIAVALVLIVIGLIVEYGIRRPRLPKTL